MPKKIQKLSVLNNLESRLNEDVDNIQEEFQELSRIAINGFDSEIEFKKYLSEGALLNVNKLVSNALSIPCGEYMVLVYASDNSVLVPTSEDTSIADAQPLTVTIHPSKLIGLWDKIERVIGEDEDSGPSQAHKMKKSKKDATTLADLFDSLPTDQASLAAEIGVDEPSVSRWTAPAGDPSHRTPTVDHIKKIANATGVGVCSVLNMVSNANSAGTKSRKGKGNSKSGSGGGAAWGGESINRSGNIIESSHQTLTIERLLKDNPRLPVLFVSDSVSGDVFCFGTYEELENEYEEYQSMGINVQLGTAAELLQSLDFSMYSDDDDYSIQR